MSQKWRKSSLWRAEFHGLGNTSNGARFEPHIAFGIKLRARLQNQQATRTGFFVVNVQYRLFLPHCACRLPRHRPLHNARMGCCFLYKVGVVCGGWFSEVYSLDELYLVCCSFASFAE